MKHVCLRRLTLAANALGMVLFCLQAQAQSEQRPEQPWYQIEVTLFAYDNALQVQEHWPMQALEQALPSNTRPLDLMLDVLSLPAWQDSAPLPTQPLSTQLLATQLAATQRQDLAVAPHTSDFRLPDPDRDAFLALPASAHGFSDTNRALTSSPDYRVLYHNAWRQPLTGANQSIPVWVSGGGLFGNRHELEGTLTLRFNPGQDRVVLDATLWLTQFSALAPVSGQHIRLPDLPPSVASRLAQKVDNITASDIQTWYPVQVIPVINAREMRSNEFHYVDHPAVGIVMHVRPYTVPPLPDEDAASVL
jgi:hypothetical protein